MRFCPGTSGETIMGKALTFSTGKGIIHRSSAVSQFEIGHKKYSWKGGPYGINRWQRR